MLQRAATRSCSGPGERLQFGPRELLAGEGDQGQQWRTADERDDSWQLEMLEGRHSSDEMMLTAMGGERAARRRGAPSGFGFFRNRMALQRTSRPAALYIRRGAWASGHGRSSWPGRRFSLTLSSCWRLWLLPVALWYGENGGRAPTTAHGFGELGWVRDKGEGPSGLG
jgi:hypothetical protein